MDILKSWLMDMTPEKQLLVNAMLGLVLWLVMLAFRPKPKRMAIFTAALALTGLLSSLLVLHAREITVIDGSGWLELVLAIAVGLPMAFAGAFAIDDSKVQEREIDGRTCKEKEN